MRRAPPTLRRMLLAVAVLYDIDVIPHDAGCTLSALPAGSSGTPDIELDWDTVCMAAASPVLGDNRSGDNASGAHSEMDPAQLNALASWLMARQAMADPTVVTDLCVLGMPAHHQLHPGPAWIREHVPGGALDLGLGYGPKAVPLPAGVLEHGEVDPASAWRDACDELEVRGALAAERDRRHRQAPLLPVGNADVVTLLGSRGFRRELVSGEGDGLVALIVPLRVRGWRATSISDPAFGPALAAAMPEQERGFDRPLLVTADEISQVRAGGDPMRLLRDEPAPPRRGTPNS